VYYSVEAAMAAELSDPISIRLPLDVLGQIEKVAKASDRNRSWLIVRALRRYLATEGADILAVIEGREQIAAGEVHEMDDVLDEIERMIRSPAGEAA
jgi:predicted transcriptional regulator